MGTVAEVLIDGTNVLAIEGHNINKSSSDFSLTPSLRIASDTAKNGETWIVETETVTLRGRTEAPEAIGVLIDGTDAEFKLDDGTWTSEILLDPGLNRITAEALNADADVVDSGLIEIIYVPPTHHCLLYTSPSPRDRS